MSIQQLASGSSNSIMSFLFHDDGSGTEGGMVLEGADFSSALHQLLGEYENEAAMKLGEYEAEVAMTLPETAASAETPELTTATNTAAVVVLPAGLLPQTLAGPVHPLSEDLEAMAADFELPAHTLMLADAGSWPHDAESPDLDESLWRIPAAKALAQNINAEPPPVLTGTMSTADYGTPASDTVSVTPAFSRGINHLIELVRDATRIAPQSAGQGVGQGVGQPDDLRTSVAHGETQSAQQSPLAESDPLLSVKNTFFAENDAPMPYQNYQLEGGNPPPVSGKSLPPEFRAPGKIRVDQLQMRPALLAEAGPLPASTPQDTLRNPELATVPTRTDGRVQLQAGRKAAQNFRSTFAGTQRMSANDSEAKAASGQAMAFAMIEKALQPEALPLDAQTSALTPTAANVQAQSMHGQNHAAPSHAVLQKTASLETLGTTFANPQLYSPHTMGTEAWLQDLGTRVEWLQDMNISTAELQLHPAELGALEIRIETENDSTTVSFVTNNAAARDIIEDTLPRLRELLANQGMQLGQSHVSQQSAEGHRRGQDTSNTPHRLQRDTGATEEAAPIRRTSYLAYPNRIDHYV